MKHTVAFLFCIFFYIIGYAQRTVNTSATQDSVQISLSATPEVVAPPAQSNSNINPTNDSVVMYIDGVLVQKDLVIDAKPFYGTPVKKNNNFFQ